MVHDNKTHTILLQLARDFFFLPALTRFGVQVSPYAYTVALTEDFTCYPQTHKHGRVAAPEHEKVCMGESLIVLYKVIALFSFQCVTTKSSCLVNIFIVDNLYFFGYKTVFPGLHSVINVCIHRHAEFYNRIY